MQRVMQQMKTERVRIGEFSACFRICLHLTDDLPRTAGSEYDWVPLWRSVLSLGGFIVSKSDRLRQSANKVDDVVSQVRYSPTSTPHPTALTLC